MNSAPVRQAALLAALLLLLVLPLRAEAQGRPAKVLHAVQLQQRDEATLVVLKTDGDATFSAYRIEGPPRLFVDLSNLQVDAGVRLGAVLQQGPLAGRVTLSEASDPMQQVVRLVVELGDVQSYDVHTEGGNIVVSLVSGAPAPRGGSGSGSGDELELARQALLQKERRLRELEEQLARATSARPPDSAAQERTRLEGEARDLRERLTRAERERDALQRKVEGGARLQGELDAAQRELNARQEALARAERDLQKVSSDLKNRDEQLQRLQRDQRQQQQEQRERDARLTQLERERADLQRQRDLQSAEVRDAREQLTALQRRAQEDAQALARTREQLQQAQRGVAQDERTRTAQLTEENKRAADRIDDLQQQLAQLQSQLQQARQDGAQRAQVEHLQRDLASAERGRADAERRVEQLQEQLRDAQRGRGDLAALQRDLQAAQRDLQAAQRDLQSTQRDLQAAQRDLQTAQRERDALRGETARLQRDLDAARRGAAVAAVAPRPAEPTTLAQIDPEPPPRRVVSAPPAANPLAPLSRDPCADKPDGAVTLYHSNFRKKEAGACRQGLRQGEWTFWDESGAVTWQGRFTDGAAAQP